MPFDVWSSLGFRTPLAWVIALGCIAIAQRRFASLGALRPPPAQALLDELLPELASGVSISEPARELAVAELNQRIAEVSFALGVFPATFSALIRISLASGSALALLGLVDLARAPLDVAVRAAVCAVSGLVGAGVVAAIGRAARERAREIRVEWDRSSREIGKEIGATLSERAARAGSGGR